MLARPETPRCIECGISFSDERFHYYYGRMEDGAAYWTDQGILCSAKCSLAHHRKRAAAGTLPDKPSDNPMERASLAR